MSEELHIVDGDLGFNAVDDRTHPSRLGEGIVAEARNVRFEKGDPQTRWVANVGVWGHSSKFNDATLLAVARWFEPETGEEAIVVVTNGQRSGGDEGVGQAWKVLPGGDPISIPLNGFDVWGACRLIPARAGLVLLRQGNDRHYLPAANVDISTDAITFNVAHNWTSGDLVFVRDHSGVATPLQPDTAYYFKSLSSTTGELYTDAALTSQVDLTTTGTLFALERAAFQPGPGGNGANPLILEPSWGSGQADTAWTNGFAGYLTNVACTVAHQASEWEALNHRFSNGQTVELAADWDVSTPSDPTTITAGTDVYVYKTDNHHFTLHSTVEDALLGQNALVDSTATAGGLTTTVAPAGASGQPIVPLHEGIYTRNRLVGLNQLNNVAVSDPGDLLHFTPFDGAKTAQLGNGDPLTALVPMGDDAILFTSKTQVLALTGLNATSSSSWQLVEVTREYGTDSPLAVLQVGRDVWMLSRNGNGVMSVKQTDFGKNQGQAIPVSLPMAGKFSEVDWDNADKACAAWFDNKALFAVPLKGQTGAPVNNCILVYNFMNQGWDGYWDGDALRPKQFFKANIGGSEKLAWIDEDGSVKWFSDDGWEDLTLAESGGEWTYGTNNVPTRIVTRGYMGGSRRAKRWDEAEVILSAANPNASITAVLEGYAEETTYRSSIVQDPTQWLTWNTADFDAENEPERAGLPYREDYGMLLEGLGFALVDEGLPADIHQTTLSEVSLVERCRLLQLKLENASGSVKWRAVWLRGRLDKGDVG